MPICELEHTFQLEQRLENTRISAVKRTISEKFGHMQATIQRYWDLRDAIMEHEFEVEFNEFAFIRDKSASGHDEAWAEFGSKWVDFDIQLESLKNEFGSIEQAFTKMKLDLLVDTDAIINQAYVILKEGTHAKSIDQIKVDGRKIFGFPRNFQEISDQECDCPPVFVKQLIWYVR